MRIELLIIGITIFAMYNTYTDGKYLKLLFSFKKYYKILFYGVLGLGVYYIMKKNPAKGREILITANDYVKFAPIDRNSLNMLSPILDFTDTTRSNSDSSETSSSAFLQTPSAYSLPQMVKATKRAVSETKKKFVAASQNWTCAHCNNQLDHTFEVDHKIRLQHGGSNDADNLVALCRQCHGVKSSFENM